MQHGIFCVWKRTRREKSKKQTSVYVLFLNMHKLMLRETRRTKKDPTKVQHYNFSYHTIEKISTDPLKTGTLSVFLHTRF